MAEKSGFLGVLKGLIGEDDGVSSAATPVPSVTIPTRPNVAVPAYPMASATVNPDVRARLEKSLESAAAPALSALQASMLKLEKAVPDYSARLGAALALLDGASSPKQVLVDIGEALDALQVQERKALDSAQSARQTQVGGIESKLAGNEAKVKDLEAEAQRIRAESSALLIEKERASAAIEATLGAITGTAAQIRNELMALKISVEQKGV